MRTPSRLLFTAIFATAALTAGAAGAEASVTSALAGPGPACTSGPESSPFAQWGDHSQYAAVPGGGFEAGLSGWLAAGSVQVKSDNEPWHVADAADRSSVELAAGATIISPSFCGGIDHPTLRMFAKSPGNGPLPTALVSVRYTGNDGLLRVLPLGLIAPAKSWQPTPITLTLSGLPLLTGTRLGVQVTALTGAIAIDDVYVDPLRRA